MADTNVYILTEEGREYTQEGCEYITNILKEQFNENNELVFNMGYAYNKPNYLTKELDLHPNSYITISTDHGITTVNPEGIPIFKRALHDFPNQTSWLTACMVFENPS